MTPIGHKLLKNGTCRFKLWAPLSRQVSLHINDGSSTSLYPMARSLHGYWRATADAQPGDLYYYILEDGKETGSCLLLAA
ncbi:MAG: hypothetical protein U5N58_07415 [Actinomycetota bacterium]|nr:hypothetical protein [Actinomycetota bacterium]